MECCDHSIILCQAAAFSVFFFDFDNRAAVTLEAYFTSAQRLICA